MELTSMKSCRRSPIRSLKSFVLCAAIPLLVIGTVSCRKASKANHSTSAPTASFAFTERIGWFQGPCLAISNQHLARGTSVALVIMDEPQKVQQTRTVDQTTDPTACKALMQGRAKMNAKPGISFYQLATRSLDPTDMGIGIVEPPASPTVENGQARIDLNKDGQSEVFSSCATSEGIKFAVWTGKAYQGEPRWSAYYYLGYDQEPNCP